MRCCDSEKVSDHHSPVAVSASCFSMRCSQEETSTITSVVQARARHGPCIASIACRESRGGGVHTTCGSVCCIAIALGCVDGQLACHVESTVLVGCAFAMRFAAACTV